MHLAFITKDLSPHCDNLHLTLRDLECHWNVVCLTKRNQGCDSWAAIDADSSA